MSACLHVCMCAMYMPGVHGVQIGFWIPGTGVTDGCELPCGCWDWNPGPPAEPSLQPLSF